MSNNSHLAIIDDDIEIRELLKQYLVKQGYNISTFIDGESFLDSTLSQYNLCILDIGLPGIDGLEVCRQLRQHSTIPIIMLTAASDDLDRILGLELGADDYMGKPFNPRELLARIKALLRRIEGSAKPEPEPDTVDRLTIDYTSRTAILGNFQLELTGTEFNLLVVLKDNAGQVLSRETIGQLIHGRKIQPFDRSIDTCISRLRGKLAVYSSNDCIQSVRGKGYVLTLHV
ncbi:MAG: response regulator transcription factor [Gammaproteobacteria bacterium]|nr:response regulator transcription factor [Gammaproteobacteria bacterium]